MLKVAARRRWPRVLGIVAAVLVVLLVAGALAVAWYFAGVAVAVTHGVDRPLTASPAGAGAVRLSDGTDAGLDGTYGLDFDGGYGRLGPVATRGAGGVVRAFTAGHGTLAPARPPASTRTPTTATRGRALGLDYQDVAVHDELGDFPAWYVPGSGPTWFVDVHGHDGARGESLRYLTALHRAGMPVLVPTYRNDVGAPASPDGIDHLGLTEWQDVNARRPLGARPRGARRRPRRLVDGRRCRAAGRRPLRRQGPDPRARARLPGRRLAERAPAPGRRPRPAPCGDGARGVDRRAPLRPRPRPARTGSRGRRICTSPRS